MRRRDLLALPLAAASAADNPPARTVKPKRLRPGDHVALITPSTETIEPDTLETAKLTCEHFGLKPRFLDSVGRRQVNHAESVANRLADFHDAFRNPEFKAVFCVRGGFGSQHLLARIDFDLVRRNPKIFVGYSDITALHLAIHKKTGLVTFHGPVPVSAFTNYTQESFRKALFGEGPIGVLKNPPEANTLRPNHRVRAIQAGMAKGRLMGGNLTLVATMMGTPFEIETEGRILFLEDVGEQVYSIDRMLTQLRLAGKLQRAAGIIWGECNDCPPRDAKPSSASAYGLSETVANLLSDLNIPALSGLTIGHTADQLTLPLGVEATLDATKGELRIDEAATT